MYTKKQDDEVGMAKARGQELSLQVGLVGMKRPISKIWVRARNNTWYSVKITPKLCS